MTSKAAMPDVQSTRDSRNVAIDRVGVKDITYPITLKTPEGGDQHTVAKINMYVSLPHHQKGTHMSRFLEVLNEEAADALTPGCISKIGQRAAQGRRGGLRRGNGQRTQRQH